MVEILPHLFVGSDKDYEKAKERGFAIVSCCKEGPHSHRALGQYTTQAAPKGDDYYFIEKGKHLALNLIDHSRPDFIPDKVIDKALEFIGRHWDKGEDVLCHCNHGHSRGPSVALMFLRSIGEMPYGYHQAMNVFKTLYEPFSPNDGVRIYTKSQWDSLEKG